MTSPDIREKAARIIYDRAFEPPVPWVEGGNSFRQDDARAIAEEVLALSTTEGVSAALVGGLGEDQGVSGAESGGTALPKSEEHGSAGWQPISTAPKDGTRVLLWIVHEPCDFSPDRFERPSIGYWLEANATPGWEREAGWEREWIGEPTRWQHLPNGPEGHQFETEERAA